MAMVSKSAVESAIIYGEWFLWTKVSRSKDGYALISEYPDIPVALYDEDNDIWWVAGYWYPKGLDRYLLKAKNGNFRAYSDRTEYSFTLELIKQTYDLSGNITEEVLGHVYVTEIRDYGNNNTIVMLDADGGAVGLEAYVGGYYLGRLTGTSCLMKSFGFTQAFPSFRTAVRHADVFGSLVLKNLGNDSIADGVYSFAKEMMNVVFGTSYEPYDVYNPITKDFPYNGRITEVTEMQFYDAHRFGFGDYGYYRINNWFISKGWISDNYPAYPYKSKVVTVGESLQTNGGSLLLSAMNLLEDPLLDAWKGLYYAYIGDRQNALSYWNKVKSKWDGTGIYMNRQNAYSGIRLGTAVALGSIVADEFDSSQWNIVDAMVEKLLQIQIRDYSLKYNKDGSVYTIYKPDNLGGFMVSYVNDPEFSAFRPSLVEDILNLVYGDITMMPPEYEGVLPANAETTLVCTMALAEYYKRRFGEEPPKW